MKVLRPLSLVVLVLLVTEVMLQALFFVMSATEPPHPRLAPIYHIMKAGGVAWEPRNVLRLVPGFPIALPTAPGVLKRLEASGKVIYSHAFTADASGRRTLSDETGLAQDTETHFLGCSFVFGMGVSDHETFSHRYQLLSSRPSHNYGVVGSSPFEAYLRLKTIPPSSSRGHVVYLFNDIQVARHVGRFVYRGRWGYSRPRFGSGMDPDGAVETWEESKPLETALHRIFWYSSICRLVCPFLGGGLDDEDFETLVQLLDKMQNHVHREHRKKKFLVLIWPGTRLAARLREELHQRGIKFLDYSQLDLEALTGGKVLIPIDGHPTALVHGIIAERLARDLRDGE